MLFRPAGMRLNSYSNARFPAAESKVKRLDPERDMDDPHGHDPAAFLALGRRLQEIIPARLAELAIS